MKRIFAGALAALCLLATPALANGYPGNGRAIDLLHPAASYSDIESSRPLALGIMRARANGFVPSPVMQSYVRGVLARLLMRSSRSASAAATSGLPGYFCFSLLTSE